MVAPAAVLDASAVLAYLQRETGDRLTLDSLRAGAAISSVNWTEVLSKLFDLGLNAETIADELTRGGVVGASLHILPFDESLARGAARLRPLTRGVGLSLGDRACLALGASLGVPVLTTDRTWQSLRIGVKVQLIR